MSATTVQNLDSTEPARAQGSTPRSLPGDAARLPIYVFIGVEALAIAAFSWIGRNQWFFLDEWDFLATRDGGSVSDVLTPHNEHWTTVPIILYRLLWNVFGLHTYLPYQLMPLLAHVAVAAMVFVVIRRVGVNPWIAVAAASLFALFGPGSQNIVWAFQITFTGGLAFGLAQLCLADHEGPVDWRDFAAIGCGLLALMCSGVGLMMLVVVGLAMFLRRSWRIALLQAGPLGIVYAAWYAVYGNVPGAQQGSASASQVLQYTGEGLKSTYRAMGQLPGLGVAMAVALVVGLGLLWKSSGMREVLSRYGAPLALLVGSVLFIASAGTARADMIFGTTSAHQSRYLYIIAAMSLPAIAVAIDAIARRWLIFFPLGLALLIVPIPWNLDEGSRQNPNLLGDRTVVVTATMPELKDVPPETLLAVPTGRSVLTFGWLRDVGREGKLPELSPRERPRAVVDWTFRLALHQMDDPVSNDCEQVDSVKTLNLSNGDSFGFRGDGIRTFNLDPGGKPLNIVTFFSLNGATLKVVVPHVNLNVRPLEGHTLSICR